MPGRNGQNYDDEVALLYLTIAFLLIVARAAEMLIIGRF